MSHGCSIPRSRVRCHAKQVALDTAEGTIEADDNGASKAPEALGQSQQQQQQPMAQLMEDEGLNAELSAANTGGLVETERDRLIRIVRDNLPGIKSLFLARCML